MDLFSLSCTKLPAGTRVMKLLGYEALSQPYHFKLDLIIPGDEGLSFEMAEAINADATLHIHSGDGAERRIFHGILSEIHWLQEVAGSAVYRVSLVPRLWKLGLNQHSDVYVDRDLKFIIKDVMSANELQEKQDYDYVLGPTKYDKYPHVSQYRESDLAFLSRRLEREGLYYYFKQLDSYEQIIITDVADKNPESGSVRYFPQGNGTAGTEGFSSFVCRQQARPKQVKLRGYDYLRPTVELKKLENVSSQGIGDVVSHDENFTTESEGQRLAKVRAEEFKAREVVFEGRGHAFDVIPGYIFDVTGHPRPSFNNKYLALSVTHEGSQGVIDEAARDGDAAPPTYMIHVVAIPEGVPFRPARVTPVPRIFGTEMGIVDGEQTSPYAQIDSHGRYKVKVFFDEHDARNGKDSTWVRMLQPHGGPNVGFHFPLRKGTEVMLVFLGGDPDHPIIAGVVPNTDTPSPVTESNATHNVIHTGGNTRIEIEDNDGAQYLKMSTPVETTSLHLGAPDADGYNVHLDSTGKALIRIGGDEDIRIKGNMTEEVTQDVKETYNQKQDTTVVGDKILKVQGTDTSTITKDQTINANANRVVKVKTNQTHEVGGDDTVKITGNHTLEVTKTETHKVTGSQTIQITGGRKETVSTKLTHTTNGPHTTTINGPVTSTINGAFTQTITQGALITSPLGYKVVAPTQWLKVTAASAELVGAKIGIVAGLKMDYASINLTGGGMKLDTLGLKLDISKVAYKNTPLTIDQSKTKLKVAVIALYMYSMTIFS